MFQRKPWESVDFTGRLCINPDCKVQLCSALAWSQGVRPAGTKPHGGRGMCHTCHTRWLRHGDWSVRVAVPARRPVKGSTRIPRDQTLDEYVMIRNSVQDIRQAAERMGMTFSALDKTLYRARKRGDSRGNAPQAQIERAISRGLPVPIVQEAP